MKHLLPILCAIFLMTIASCNQIDVDPNVFRHDGQPKDNTYVLRDQTSVLLEADQDAVLAVDSASVLFSSSSAFASTLAVGKIIVNPFGGSNAFLRRIIGMTTDAGGIRVQTEQAQMTEAFSAWIIDSRTNKLTIKTRSGWQDSYNFSEDIGGVDFSFGGAVDYQVTLDASCDEYGIEYYWEEGNPDYLYGPYIWLYLNNLILTFDGKSIMTFQGGASLTAAPEAPFTVGQIPYANFLTLYVNPSAGVNAGFEGTFTSPELVESFGPYNLSAWYDSETGQLYFEPLPAPAIDGLINPPTIDNLSGQLRATLGVEFIVAPTGIYESGLNDVAEMKFYINSYVYQDYLFQHKGNFDDRQPRVAFDGAMGFGFNFGVEFNLFDGVITSSLAADDEEYEWYKWNIGTLNTCDQFSSATLTYTGGQVDISMGSGPDHNIGYNIWVNDELFSQQLYSYDQSYTIDLPPSTSLVNKIAITDYYSLACYLEDIYVDPSLVGNCTDKFVDPRDGNEYCYTEIGGLTWMSENLRYTNGGATGKWYNNIDSDENLIYGRLYTFAEIDNICPSGWHIPTNFEWDQLIDALGGDAIFGKNAKAASSLLWPASELPAMTTFGAVPAGEYYSWLEGNSQYNAFGNKGKYARFWSSSLLDGAPTMVEISASNQGEVNTGESANLIGLSKFKSIREIGFSCRCVRD